MASFTAAVHLGAFAVVLDYYVVEQVTQMAVLAGKILPGQLVLPDQPLILH